MAGYAVTGSTYVGRLIAKYYDRVLLDNLYPDLHLYQFGDKKSLPEGTGTTVYFNRYGKLAAAGALTEGTVLATSALSAGYVSATVAGYGIGIAHTDLFIATAVSDVVEGSVRECAKSIALAIDSKIKTTLSGLTAGLFVGGGGELVHSVHTACFIQGAEIVKAVAKLDNTNAKPFADGYYAGVFHPKGIYDLRSDTATGGWVDSHKYAAPENLYTGEVGRLYGVRCVMSSNMKALVGNAGMCVTVASGYQGFIIGQGAYGVVELNGLGAKTYIKQLGSAGTADPVNQKATVGAKVYFAVANLDVAKRVCHLATGGRL